MNVKLGLFLFFSKWPSHRIHVFEEQIIHEQLEHWLPHWVFALMSEKG